MKQILKITLASLLLSACEKEINIDLNSSEPQIVIEGTITNQPGPYTVSITRTLNFSDDKNYPSLSNARVIISDNMGNSDTLQEIAPGKYQTNTIIGIPERTYYLSISADGKTFNAISTMPSLVNLDTLKFTKVSRPGSNNNFSSIPVFNDPAEFGNNYRFLLSVNGVPDKSILIFNDNITNGTLNQRPLFSPNVEIKSGDSVSIEMRCIDSNIYNYFFTLSQIAGNGIGGGTTPANPKNNIQGDKALGYFSAHTSQSITQQVQ